MDNLAGKIAVFIFKCLILTIPFIAMLIYTFVKTVLLVAALLVPVGITYLLTRLIFMLPEVGVMRGASVWAFIAAYAALGWMDLCLLVLSLVWIVFIFTKLGETWQEFTGWIQRQLFDEQS